MANVTFRAKVKDWKYVDGTSAGKRLEVPALNRGHCDMSAFRQHAKYGIWANSDMFESILNKAVKTLLGEQLKLDRVPAGVNVDTSGFLATVSFEL